MGRGARRAERRRLPDAGRGERVRPRLAAGAGRSTALKAYGARRFTPGRPILEAARELTTRIKTDFEYHPGATDICTPLAEVFAGKAGVCQDFAHVEIAALRAHGLAAAYVSGYIRTVHSKEEIELRGADASHAWVAVWCGEEAGWVHLDPTNDLVAREDHVAVAWGRDFSDVSPLRGVILGGELPLLRRGRDPGADGRNRPVSNRLLLDHLVAPAP